MRFHVFCGLELIFMYKISGVCISGKISEGKHSIKKEKQSIMILYFMYFLATSEDVYLEKVVKTNIP